MYANEPGPLNPHSVQSTASPPVRKISGCWCKCCKSCHHLWARWLTQTHWVRLVKNAACDWNRWKHLVETKHRAETEGILEEVETDVEISSCLLISSQGDVMWKWIINSWPHSLLLETDVALHKLYSSMMLRVSVNRPLGAGSWAVKPNEPQTSVPLTLLKLHH